MSEKFLKSLATDYVRIKGAEFLRENRESESNSEPDDFTINRLDAKIYEAIMREKSSAKRRKRIATWSAIAASLVIAVFAISFLYEFQDMDDTPSFDMAVAGIPEAMAAGQGEYGGWTQADGGWVQADEDFSVSPRIHAEPELEMFGIDAPLEPQAVAPNISDDMRQITIFASLSIPDNWRAFHTADADTLRVHSPSGSTIIAQIAESVDYDLHEGFREFQELTLDDVSVFLYNANAESILLSDISGFRISLSTHDDYQDLITLAEHWISVLHDSP
ncbi:MAG: hypothetical protein FWF81_00205 [Defluviitaleaceae bacterium]|nr:hypothetical protein [Defluviitaleaceae bacterium]